MASENWRINLEAYLDGELPAQEADAFAAAAAADPVIGAEIEARLAMRKGWHQALGEPMTLAPGLLPTSVGPVRTRIPADRRPIKTWIPVALAACLALAVGIPHLLRNDNGAEGPRSTITRDGQVVAIRYGETPGRTVHLEPDAMELPAGLSR